MNNLPIGKGISEHLRKTSQNEGHCPDDKITRDAVFSLGRLHIGGGGGGQVQGDKALMGGLMRGDIDLMGGT